MILEQRCGILQLRFATEHAHLTELRFSGMNLQFHRLDELAAAGAIGLIGAMVERLARLDLASREPPQIYDRDQRLAPIN